MTDKIEISEDETQVEYSRRAITARLGLVAAGAFVAPMALTVNEAEAGRRSGGKRKSRRYKGSKSSHGSKSSKSSHRSKCSPSPEPLPDSD